MHHVYWHHVVDRHFDSFYQTTHHSDPEFGNLPNGFAALLENRPPHFIELFLYLQYLVAGLFVDLDDSDAKKKVDTK